MSKLALAAQMLLGLIFFVFGLNGFFEFLAMPEMPAKAGALMGAFAGTGYFFPVLKITEIVAGALLLLRKFPALALVLLAPIVVQIFLFHAILTPGIQNLVMPILLVALEGYLGFVVYKERFSRVLAP